METKTKTHDKEALILLNESYHRDHTLVDKDVDKANFLMELIESDRDPVLAKPGDVIVAIGYRSFDKRPAIYAGGHIDAFNYWDDDKYHCCTQPYTSFVTAGVEHASFDTSGGYWFGAKMDQLKYIGPQEKIFKSWGHCGPCGNGAFDFKATVNAWLFVDVENIY